MINDEDRLRNTPPPYAPTYLERLERFLHEPGRLMGQEPVRWAVDEITRLRGALELIEQSALSEEPGIMQGIAREALASVNKDQCAECGHPRKEHSINGACYGLCGEFVPIAPAEKEDAGSTG
jgi:hypothetical protein